jgi:transporter family protein
MNILDWRLFAFGSAFFAALTAIFGKIGVSGVGSNAATFFRTIVILLTSAALLTYWKEWEDPRNWSSRTIIFLVLSGIATGFSWLCYYRALQMAPASRVAPIDKLSVVLVILLAALFLGEKITLKIAFGAGLVAAGAIILAL